MGYYISSVYAVSPNDTHAFFIYFIPAHQFEWNWINEWMTEHFQQIAEAIGPDKGVIIAPSPKHDEMYLGSFLQMGSAGCFFAAVYPEMTGGPDMDEDYSSEVHDPFFKEESILYRGYPIIIFSRTPIHVGMDKNEAVLINLASCEDEKDLGKVIDILFSVIKNNDMGKLQNLHQVLGTPAENSNKAIKVFNHINETVELKPNFFGLGINFNYLLQKLAEAILSKKKSD